MLHGAQPSQAANTNSASIQAGTCDPYRTSGSISAPLGQTIVPSSSSTLTRLKYPKSSCTGRKIGPRKYCSTSTSFRSPVLNSSNSLNRSLGSTLVIHTISLAPQSSPSIRRGGKPSCTRCQFSINSARCKAAHSRTRTNARRGSFPSVNSNVDIVTFALCSAYFT